jgi:mannitol-1-/sugar-/sorbitol-6-phosphatase
MSPVLWFDCAALIFDLDGTLVDSHQAVVSAWEWWAARHGIDLNTVLAVSHGRPSRDVIRELAPQADALEEERTMLAREESEVASLALVPDADRMLAEARGGAWTVVTSCPLGLARARLSAVGLPVPASIVTADQVRNAKPDPEPFLLAASRLNVSPAECLVFEDAPSGIIAAQRALMRVVAVESHKLPQALPATDARVPDFRTVHIEKKESGYYRVVIRA